MPGLEEQMERQELSKKVEKFHNSILSKLNERLQVRYVYYHNLVVSKTNLLVNIVLDFKVTYKSQIFFDAIFPFLTFNVIFTLTYFLYSEKDFTVWKLLWLMNVSLISHGLTVAWKSWNDYKQSRIAIEKLKQFNKDIEEFMEKET